MSALSALVAEWLTAPLRLLLPNIVAKIVRFSVIVFLMPTGWLFGECLSAFKRSILYGRCNTVTKSVFKKKHAP